MTLPFDDMSITQKIIDKVEKYLENNYHTTLGKFRQDIANACLNFDYYAYNVLVKLFRYPREIRIENEEDNDQPILSDELRFTFPSIYYKELSSGSNIGNKIGKGKYEILNKYNKVINYINPLTLKNMLIDDIELDDNFDYRFNDLIIAIYDWMICEEKKQWKN